MIHNSIDIETDGLELKDKINFIGIHTFKDEDDPGTYHIIDCTHGLSEDDRARLMLLAEPSNVNIFHNGKFDTKMIKYHYGIDIPMTHDTMLLAYLCSTAPELNENRGKWLGLKACAKRLLHVDDWDVALSKKTSHTKAEVEPYLKKDVYYTRRIFEYFKKHFNKCDLQTYKLILKATKVYEQVELNGLPINLKQLDETIKEFEDELEGVKIDLAYYGDINWNSPKQLQDLLYNKLKLPIPGYTETNQPATGIEALTKLKGTHPIVDLILKNRECEKALTFLHDWKERNVNGRLYPCFNLHTTVTGRTSCNGPNLQQIPRNKKLKTLFQSTDPDWEMVCIDYSQAELRFASIVAGVEAIKKAYRNNEDLHTNMAALVANKPKEEVTKVERTRAKAANFGYLYGMQASTFVSYAKIGYGVDMSLEEATKIRDHFFKENYELHRYYHDTQEELITRGYVTSIMGRRYNVGFKHLMNFKERNEYMRKILNFPVQSAASDFVLCALIEVNDRYPLDEVRICATVHDSIIMEIKHDDKFDERVRTIQSIMQNPKLAKEYLRKPIDIPIKADIEIGPLGKGVDLEEFFKKNY